jgi:Domain of unknown function (DUF932)/Fibronectin type III-like domain
MTGGSRGANRFRAITRPSARTPGRCWGSSGERSRIVQNEQAFAFVDQLLGSSLHFGTAGSLAGGRRVWVLATLPEPVQVGGDAVRPYVLLMNSHDGSTRGDRGDHSAAQEPPKRLKGYANLTLGPGESRFVLFRLRPSDLAYFDASRGRRTVAPGRYRVLLGTSSTELDQATGFRSVVRAGRFKPSGGPARTPVPRPRTARVPIFAHGCSGVARRLDRCRRSRLPGLPEAIARGHARSVEGS